MLSHPGIGLECSRHSIIFNEGVRNGSLQSLVGKILGTVETGVA